MLKFEDVIKSEKKMFLNYKEWLSKKDLEIIEKNEKLVRAKLLVVMSLIIILSIILTIWITLKINFVVLFLIFLSFLGFSLIEYILNKRYKSKYDLEVKLKIKEYSEEEYDILKNKFINMGNISKINLSKLREKNQKFIQFKIIIKKNLETTINYVMYKMPEQFLIIKKNNQYYINIIGIDLNDSEINSFKEEINNLITNYCLLVLENDNSVEIEKEISQKYNLIYQSMRQLSLTNEISKISINKKESEVKKRKKI